MHKLKNALLMVGAAACFNVHAAPDGRVTFNGTLTDDTCQVKQSSKDIIVTLPTIATARLASAGDVAGTTAFKIEVVSCPVSVKRVSAHFEAVQNSGYDPTTGNLRNIIAKTGGGASNVQVRLYNMDDNSQVNIGQTGHPYQVNDSSHEATMYFAGGYYATGTAEAGKVNANVQYVIAYP
ncbi:F17 fimbrial protein [Erwinia sp. OLTSP20]|uniref:fimbrial protein n=1 Tax=unclassified Erwinia TaxID=2622719 RepID=UPI000C187C6B|nr:MULTISPECIES: fimbrial protein [unclassified Erwinia]PIJ49609.1 F17 fimbrial protein [Erwinia sp. OAMSP11]PIJ71605.1 F17 fimbrial protein [Erwinia sp. OLSSP12]PIJ82675.1 F17 fimbrial protein [Erwinia sp. OLCASP19]PIJ83142.1 F17 fimbrial protein [Erwinia sp. OLMTSP26]PIJ85308.1 F17 fimbrial protein [Erwinia sp. OLMDSP33]